MMNSLLNSRNNRQIECPQIICPECPTENNIIESNIICPKCTNTKPLNYNKLIKNIKLNTSAKIKCPIKCPNYNDIVKEIKQNE